MIKVSKNLKNLQLDLRILFIYRKVYNRHVSNTNTWSNWNKVLSSLIETSKEMDYSSPYIWHFEMNHSFFHWLEFKLDYKWAWKPPIIFIDTNINRRHESKHWPYELEGIHVRGTYNVPQTRRRCVELDIRHIGCEWSPSYQNSAVDDNKVHVQTTNSWDQYTISSLKFDFDTQSVNSINSI